MDSKSISLSEEMVLRFTHWKKMLLMLFLIACIMLCGHSKKETIQMEFGKNISLICSNHTWSELIMQKWTIWKLGVGNCDIAVHYNGTMVNNCTNNPVYVNSINPHLSISNFESNYVGKYSCEYTFNGGTDKIDYYLWGVDYINHTFGKDVSLNCTQQRSQENINEMQQLIKYNEECLAVGINQTLNSTCQKKEGITTEIKDEQIYIHIHNFQLNDTGNYTCESKYNEEQYKIVFILTGHKGTSENNNFSLTTYLSVGAGVLVAFLIFLVLMRLYCKSKLLEMKQSRQNQELQDFEPYSVYTEKVNVVYER